VPKNAIQVQRGKTTATITIPISLGKTARDSAVDRPALRAISRFSTNLKRKESMGLLGNFLESFYGIGQTFQSVQAHVRREKMPTARGETSRRGAIGRARTTAKSNIATVNMKFWAVLPDHVRVDETRIKDGEPETTVEITR
jgi:hypothetical protein